MAYTVIAKWTAKEGQEEPVAAALSSLVGPSRNEPGNLTYQVHRDPEDARVFVIYELYVDEDAYHAHADSPHFREIAGGGALDLLEGRERTFLETWDGDD